MKKSIALLLALVMICGLVACGNKAPAADAPAANAPTEGVTINVAAIETAYGSQVWADVVAAFEAETYTKGFLTACPGLTPMEIQMLPMGAKRMTLECGVRFLTDYLDGDHYFANRREGQNLDRCRTQFKLVADMEGKWEQMHKIVEEVTK